MTAIRGSFSGPIRLDHAMQVAAVIIYLLIAVLAAQTQVGLPTLASHREKMPALTGWAVGLWNRATQSGPPVFDDLHPFDEF